MNKAEYNFNQNILKASSVSCKSIQEAILEWEYFHEAKSSDGLCICQRKIKNVKYFINRKTKRKIMVGSTCCKHFVVNTIKIKNKILESYLKDTILKGEYQIIDNMIEYSNSIEQQLIEHFERYSSSKNMFQIKSAIREIQVLMDDYSFHELEGIFNTLSGVLSNRIELEEIEQKRTEDENIKNGRIRCCRCSSKVDENYRKYDDNRIRCKECSQYINNWLSKGYGIKSFTF